MPDYPGVDPDGLNPGGLQVAGRVNASILSLLGQDIIPSVFGWGSWSGDSGIVVPIGTSVNLPLDTEVKALAGVTLASPDDKVTFDIAGTYLAFAAVVLNSGTLGGGSASSSIGISGGTAWGIPSPMPVTLLGSMTQIPLMICDVAIGATLHVEQFTDAGNDINFSCQLTILRLA